MFPLGLLFQTFQINVLSTFSNSSQSLFCSFMELVTLYLDQLYQSDCFQVLICRAQGVPGHDSGSHSAGAGVTKSAATHIFGLLLQPEELPFCFTLWSSCEITFVKNLKITALFTPNIFSSQTPFGQDLFVIHFFIFTLPGPVCCYSRH